MPSNANNVEALYGHLVDATFDATTYDEQTGMTYGISGVDGVGSAANLQAAQEAVEAASLYGQYSGAAWLASRMAHEEVRTARTSLAEVVPEDFHA